jgi:hypothetical protein
MGKIAMKNGVPASQWRKERDAARARSRPLADDARRVRDAVPEPVVRHVHHAKPKPEQGMAARIHWFIGPRPLIPGARAGIPGANLQVIGVALDAHPDVLAQYGVEAPA